jgi:hypothetical protein
MAKGGEKMKRRNWGWVENLKPGLEQEIPDARSADIDKQMSLRRASSNLRFGAVSLALPLFERRLVQ